MALTLESISGTRHELRGVALVGRSTDADVVVPFPEVSARHAEFRWTTRGWTVRDLGSRNGTFLDGRRIEPGDDVPVAIGARVGFASADGWVVQSAMAPEAVATAPDRRQVRDDGGVIAIPDAEDPAVTVVSTRHGWVVERPDGQAASVSDGDVLDIDGVPWRLSLPAPQAETSDVGDTSFLHEATLSFRVSRDEEHVELTVHVAGKAHRLKPRAHHYTLLTLARCRIDDARAGELPSEERGWVLQEQLERMLNLGANAVYQHIHRARRELSELGVAGSSDIVQRRPAAGQLRIGSERLEVGSM